MSLRPGVCSDCRPEFLETCYRCGHRFREYESYYIVKRLMDQNGMENPYYGIKYGRCQECPRDSLTYKLRNINWHRR